MIKQRPTLPYYDFIDPNDQKEYHFWTDADFDIYGMEVRFSKEGGEVKTFQIEIFDDAGVTLGHVEYHEATIPGVVSVFRKVESVDVRSSSYRCEMIFECYSRIEAGTAVAHASAENQGINIQRRLIDVNDLRC